MARAEIYGRRILAIRTEYESVDQRLTRRQRTVDRAQVRNSGVVVEGHEFIGLPGNRRQSHITRETSRWQDLEHVIAPGNHRHLFPAVQTADLAPPAPAIEWHRLALVVVGTENKAVGSGRHGRLVIGSLRQERSRSSHAKDC